MKLSIGSDHAGFALKKEIVIHLSGDHQVEDFGTHSEESTDYPLYAHLVAESVEKGDSALGILICGSANGVCMTANKHAGIRAALCWKEEIAVLARAHNNANVLCLPARYLTSTEALSIVRAFLTQPFEGGRHERRVNQISCS
jgi:ribose 5-phosphate isomerase B